MVQVNIYQETIVINFNERNRFRLENEARQHSAIKVRYAWFWAKVGFIILVMTGYGAFGNAFANVPQEYQWILGLLSPIAKDLSLKLLIKIVYKSAGLGSTGAKSCKFPVIHYITTKHAVFLAIVVGNVSTPLTTYCIIATDFAKTVYTALKIIRNKRRGKNVEGKHWLLPSGRQF